MDACICLIWEWNTAATADAISAIHNILSIDVYAASAFVGCHTIHFRHDTKKEQQQVLWFEAAKNSVNDDTSSVPSDKTNTLDRRVAGVWHLVP